MKRIVALLLILVASFLISACSEKNISPELNNGVNITNELSHQNNSTDKPIIDVKKIVNTSKDNNTDYRTKFFDWNVRLIGCTGCDRSETAEFRAEILSALPEGDYQFDGYDASVNDVRARFNDLPENYTIYGVYLNLTNIGNNGLDEMNLSEYGIRTVYINGITDNTIQKALENYTELRSCEEETDCIMVGTDCCASANCGYTAISTKFQNQWSSKFNCSDTSCIATICMKAFSVRCLDNQCALEEYTG